MLAILQSCGTSPDSKDLLKNSLFISDVVIEAVSLRALGWYIVRHSILTICRLCVIFVPHVHCPFINFKSAITAKSFHNLESPSFTHRMVTSVEKTLYT